MNLEERQRKTWFAFILFTINIMDQTKKSHKRRKNVRTANTTYNKKYRNIRT